MGRCARQRFAIRRPRPAGMGLPPQCRRHNLTTVNTRTGRLGGHCAGASTPTTPTTAPPQTVTEGVSHDQRYRQQSSYLSSLFGTNGTNGTSSTSSASSSSSLSAQTEEELFASIDSERRRQYQPERIQQLLQPGDRHRRQHRERRPNALFSQMSGGAAARSVLQQFESNAGDLASGLQSGSTASSSSVGLTHF